MNLANLLLITSNVKKEILIHIHDALLGQMSEQKGLPPLVLSLSDSCRMPVHTVKTSRDDTLHRYTRMATRAELPYFDKDDAKFLFEDLTKHRNPNIVDSRSVIALVDAEGSAALCSYANRIIFVVNPEHSAVPFMFKTIKAMRDSGVFAPCHVVVTGTNLIEKAAEFFVTARTELKNLVGSEVDITFAGIVTINPDELDLAVSFQLSLIEAFRGGLVHGQVKSIASKVFSTDSEPVELGDKALKEVLGYLNGICA